MDKLRIGPAGNSSAFYESGRKSTWQAPEWLKEIGLNAFEYSFGRGISMLDETAKLIGSEMKKHDIAVSCHAPYYINFANETEQAQINNIEYIKNSINKLNIMGGKRVVFHPGVYKKSDPKSSVLLVAKRIEQTLEQLFSDNITDFYLCCETMGRYSQIGTVEEVIFFSSLNERIIPCLDFGHINSRTNGGLKTVDDFKRVIDMCASGVGDHKTKNIHVHFSKIQYGDKGEIRHLDFTDTVYGPEFEPFARVIADYKLTPVIICESSEKMSDDALIMKNILQKLL